MHYSKLGFWRLSALVLFPAAVFSPACGLIDFDSFNGLNFELPPENFVIDTESGEWEKPPFGAIPAVACVGADKTPCCSFPGVDCNTYPLVCQNSQCVYVFTYEAAQEVNLSTSVSQLNSVQGTTLSAINLKTIVYDVKNNLNSHLPPVEIWVAPQGTTSKTHASARKVTTLPAQALMSAGVHTVNVDAAGQAAFSSFARTFKTPFTLLTVIDMSLAGGQIVPQGKADITITGKIEAKL